MNDIQTGSNRRMDEETSVGIINNICNCPGCVKLFALKKLVLFLDISVSLLKLLSPVTSHQITDAIVTLGSCKQMSEHERLGVFTTIKMEGKNGGITSLHGVITQETAT
jgi:hypothetical protein